MKKAKRLSFLRCATRAWVVASLSSFCSSGPPVRTPLSPGHSKANKTVKRAKRIKDNISFCRPKCDTLLSITVTIIGTVEPFSINQFIPCATANRSGQGGRNGQQFAFRLDNNHVPGCERKCAGEAVLEPKRVQPSPADGTFRYGGLQQAAIIDTGAQ